MTAVGRQVSRTAREVVGIRTRIRVPGDLFAPRTLPVHLPAMIRERRPRSGPPEGVLMALAADGLPLRQIAEQAGLSHESVRRRLAGRPQVPSG
jgi:hypothetical protein